MDRSPGLVSARPARSGLCVVILSIGRAPISIGAWLVFLHQSGHLLANHRQTPAGLPALTPGAPGGVWVTLTLQQVTGLAPQHGAEAFEHVQRQTIRSLPHQLGDLRVRRRRVLTEHVDQPPTQLGAEADTALGHDLLQPPLDRPNLRDVVCHAVERDRPSDRMSSIVNRC